MTTDVSEKLINQKYGAGIKYHPHATIETFVGYTHFFV